MYIFVRLRLVNTIIGGCVENGLGESVGSGSVGVAGQYV